MPRHFSQSTAEQTVAVAAAVDVFGTTTKAKVRKFCDFTEAQCENALALAVDVGLVSKTASKFSVGSPLTRFLNTPSESQKAATLRVVLESYEPFVVLRERLIATNSVDEAAHQTITILGISAHREEVKDTLISLGTFANALKAEGAGRYTSSALDLKNDLQLLADACSDSTTSETQIWSAIGATSAVVSHEEVVRPLANALVKGRADESAEAVTEAAKAVESFLVRLASRTSVDLTGANGIIQKLDKFRSANVLPKKLVESGRYLGQIRNAADHGVDIDPDVGAVWRIQATTGIQYVFVACSFIAACLERERNGDFIL